MTYTLPDLPYAYDALEPHLDAKTLEIHHSKHHQTYVNGLNATNEKIEKARQEGDYAAVKALKKELAFHGAGHFLHSLYWENMSPEKTQLSSELSAKIEETWGSFENFEKEFKATATVVEASGWALLIALEDGSLQILTIEKHQDLFVPNAKILLACDVWEHAYYLKFQNRRPEYIDSFWNVVNWAAVSERY